jgi:hypothetical protein
MIRPKVCLLEGAQILEEVLQPKGFKFRFHGEGKSSGGEYASGEFFRADRRLEVHFRWNLGMVRYHVGDQSASHESYMRELGVREKCHYPGFSEDPKDAFLGLAHDLTFADEFLTGTGAVLRRASTKEASDEATRHADLMSGYVGDKREIERLRNGFRDKRYDDVVASFDNLKNPERLAGPERRMVEIARKNARVSPKRTARS